MWFSFSRPREEKYLHNFRCDRSSGSPRPCPRGSTTLKAQELQAKTLYNVCTSGVTREICWGETVQTRECNAPPSKLTFPHSNKPSELLKPCLPKNSKNVIINATGVLVFTHQ